MINIFFCIKFALQGALGEIGRPGTTGIPGPKGKLNIEIRKLLNLILLYQQVHQVNLVHQGKYLHVDHAVKKVKKVPKVKLADLVFLAHLVTMHHSFMLHLVHQALKDIQVMLGKIIHLVISLSLNFFCFSYNGQAGKLIDRICCWFNTNIVMYIRNSWITWNEWCTWYEWFPWSKGRNEIVLRFRMKRYLYLQGESGQPGLPGIPGLLL